MKEFDLGEVKAGKPVCTSYEEKGIDKRTIVEKNMGKAIARQVDLFGDVHDIESPKRKTAFYDYEGFIGKFKPKKTTDDCYTPQEIYNEVLAFVKEHCGISGRPVVRPFYPGGDYERYEYPQDCVVVDNPPFSIYSRIVRFYLKRGISFFLFAPHLTAFVLGADCTYVLTNAGIRYENGAVVNTSFCTNMLGDLRIWLCPQLGKRLKNAQMTSGENKLPVREYPKEVLTSALSGKYISAGVEFKVRKDECEQVRNLDGIPGKPLFGSGLLLAEKLAGKLAGKRHVEHILLSEREKAIVRRISMKRNR